jgi:altronate dehydratase small subunit
VKKLAVVAHANDNVATAVKDLKEGQEVMVDVDGKEVKVKLLNDVLFGHKFALKDISKGENIIKYSEVIGKATQLIKMGEHVHVHNIESVRGRGDWEGDS